MALVILGRVRIALGLHLGGGRWELHRLGLLPGRGMELLGLVLGEHLGPAIAALGLLVDVECMAVHGKVISGRTVRPRSRVHRRLLHTLLAVVLFHVIAPVPRIGSRGASLPHTMISSTLASRRAYATLSALSQPARLRAEKLSAEWKGTHATGGNTKNYIGGQFVDSKAAVWHDVVDPVRLRPLLVSSTHLFRLQSTQTLLTRVPETTSTEFEQAVDAASQAYKTWSRQSVLSRQRFAIESVIFRLSHSSCTFMFT